MEPFKIKAFGILAEKLPESEFEFPFYQNTEELMWALKKEYPQLDSLKFSVAVNKEVVQQNHALHENDEIALLPPFSGG